MDSILLNTQIFPEHLFAVAVSIYYQSCTAKIISHLDDLNLSQKHNSKRLPAWNSTVIATKWGQYFTTCIFTMFLALHKNILSPTITVNDPIWRQTYLCFFYCCFDFFFVLGTFHYLASYFEWKRWKSDFYVARYDELLLFLRSHYWLSRVYAFIFFQMSP